MTNNSNNNKHESPLRYDKYLDLFNTDNNPNYAGNRKGRYFIDRLTKKADDIISHNGGPIDNPADMKDFLVSHTLDLIPGYNDIAFNPTSRITLNDNDSGATIHPDWLLFFANMANNLGGHIIKTGHPVFDALKKLQPAEEVDKILLLFYSNLILKYEINGGWADLNNEPIYDANGRLPNITGLLFKDSLKLSDFLHSITSMPNFNNITGKKNPGAAHLYDVGHNPLFFKGINNISKLPILTIPVPLFGYNPLELTLQGVQPVRVQLPGGGGEGHYNNWPMIDHTNRIAAPPIPPTFCSNKDANTRGIRLWADDLHPLHLCASSCPGDFRGNLVDKIIKYVEDNGILNATAVCNTFKDLILHGAMEVYNVNTAPGGGAAVAAREMEVNQIYGPTTYADLNGHTNLPDLQKQSRLYWTDFRDIANKHTLSNAKVSALVRNVQNKLWCSPIDGVNGILVSTYSTIGRNAGANANPHAIYARKVAIVANAQVDYEYNKFTLVRSVGKTDDLIDYQVLLSSPETIIMQLHLYSKNTPITDLNLKPYVLNELLVLRDIDQQIRWLNVQGGLVGRGVGVAFNGAIPRCIFVAHGPAVNNAIGDNVHMKYITNRAFIPYNNIINRFYTRIIYPLIFLLYNLKQAPAHRNIVYAIPQMPNPAAVNAIQNVVVGTGAIAAVGAQPNIMDAFNLLTPIIIGGAANGAPGNGLNQMYFLNDFTAPYDGIQYDAYIYIAQILNYAQDSFISHAYNQHYGRIPPGVYGTAAAGAAAAYNNGVMTDGLLNQIINELIILESIEADNVAGISRTQTNAVLGWLKENYLDNIREFAKSFMNRLPAPVPNAAWGITYRAEQINTSELQLLTNKVLYNPVNHHRFEINKAEFELLSNIMNEYLQYYKELRGKFFKRYTDAKFFSIDLKKLIERQLEDKKHQFKKGIIQYSKRLGLTHERKDPYKFAILTEYNNVYNDKNNKNNNNNNNNNITYIYEDDSIFIYDPTKPGNKGPELTIDQVKDSIDKEFKCNKTIGLNNKNASPQDQQYICAEFFLNCIQGNDAANITQCKQFMTDDDYWDNAAEEVDNIPLLMALKTLTAFGFEKESDVDSDNDYVKMMSFDTWLNSLIKNKSISGDTSTPGTEAYKINENVKLKGYLTGLVDRINMNPSIINPDYKHPVNNQTNQTNQTNRNNSYNAKPEYQGYLSQFNKQRGGEGRVQQYDKFALGGRINNVFDNINDLNRIIETHLYDNTITQYGGSNQASPNEIKRFNNVENAIKARVSFAMAPQYEKIFKDLTSELKKRKKALKPDDHRKILDMIKELKNNELILNDILLAENIYIHALDIYGSDITQGPSLSYDELEQIAELKNKKIRSRDKKVKKLQDIVIKLGLIAGYP